MNYVEYSPHPALRSYIECIWFAEDGGSSLSSRPERVLPDGCVEWILHLANPYRQFANGSWRQQGRSFVVGELTRFLLLQPAGPVSTMGVRFRPLGAYRFFNFSLHELTDRLVPSRDIWADSGSIEEAIFEASSHRARKEVVERFLTHLLERSAHRPRFEVAVARIIRSRGQTRIRDIASEALLSPRQLEREFRAYLGISPKSLARIVRFQTLLSNLGEQQLREWASLALAAGYADQPHMVREFRAFAGQTPTDKISGPNDGLSHNFISPKRLASLLG